MDLDQLQKLEVAERIAFERGRQAFLSTEHPDYDPPNGYEETKDLNGAVGVDVMQPLYDSFNRGYEFGARQSEEE